MPFTSEGIDESMLDIVMRFQNGLIACATGGSFQDAEYRELRSLIMDDAECLPKFPDFVRRCSDAGQFWGHIKYAASTYQERRNIIWSAFRPLIDYLEAKQRAPGLQTITGTLEAYDPEHVQAVWQKALDRRMADPEGAITAARSLVESVCKHVLDDTQGVYSKDDDLPKLWRMAAEKLNLAPSQHQEEAFKSILGACQTIVNTLANIRNRVGDAHGQGRNAVRPLPRHAELAVNLAGAMSAFMIATLEAKKSK